MPRIAIAATANWIEDDLLASGLKVLREAGLTDVVLADQISVHFGDLAGDDGIRTRAFEALWQRADVPMILNAAGGYGSIRLLPLLDWSKDNPAQTWMGFSDFTVMLNARVAKNGGWGWHGPLLSRIAQDAPRQDAALALDILAGNPPGGYDASVLEGCKVITAGQARGRLIGGNLASFRSLLGTAFIPQPQEGDILFFEDIDEKDHGVDRDLTQFALAGYFDKAAAVIFGRFTNLRVYEPKPFAFTLEEILTFNLRRLGFTGPVIMDFPAGHAGVNLPLPIGKTVSLEAGNGGVALNWENTAGFNFGERQ